jgi:hypothetical protein
MKIIKIISILILSILSIVATTANSKNSDTASNDIIALEKSVINELSNLNEGQKKDVINFIMKCDIKNATQNQSETYYDLVYRVYDQCNKLKKELELQYPKFTSIRRFLKNIQNTEEYVFYCHPAGMKVVNMTYGQAIQNLNLAKEQNNSNSKVIKQYEKGVERAIKQIIDYESACSKEIANKNSILSKFEELYFQANR